jgi:hypothetical protein
MCSDLTKGSFTLSDEVLSKSKMEGKKTNLSTQSNKL